jgi:hypothetical protein
MIAAGSVVARLVAMYFGLQSFGPRSISPEI